VTKSCTLREVVFSVRCVKVINDSSVPIHVLSEMLKKERERETLEDGKGD